MTEPIGAQYEDPSGEQTYDCLFYDWRWRQPLTGPLDFRDFLLPNILRHRVVEAMHRYRLPYSELGLELDLEWTFLMVPHEMGHGGAQQVATSTNRAARRGC